MEIPCRPDRRVVARGAMCSIEECSCGVLHVTLGVLTLRLQREVVASIAETFDDALRTLAASSRVDDLFAPRPSPSTERPS